MQHIFLIRRRSGRGRPLGLVSYAGRSADLRQELRYVDGGHVLARDQSIVLAIPSVGRRIDDEKVNGVASSAHARNDLLVGQPFDVDAVHFDDAIARSEAGALSVARVVDRANELARTASFAR